MRRLCLALALAVVLTPVAANAEAYLRVIAQEAPVHTGPSPRYRQIYAAPRGEVLRVLERGTLGYWFRVELDDGTTGSIFGELVFPFEVVESEDPGFVSRVGRGVRDAVLAPSPVPRADVEISVSAGALDREGIFLLRPGWLLDPYFALEGFLGLSPREQEDLFLGGLGWTLRLIPGAAVGPYLNAGVGAAHIRPKADNFTQDSETLLALCAGGGFEVTFKKQITVRLDYRNWTIFDPDQASNGQEFSGGLAIFFKYLALIAVLALAGCGRHAVRASEKEFLADRTMQFDADGQEAAADQHVNQNREGAAGGRGSGGGGCGCN